ncbi:hypothetical protein H6501_02755 [Candidatus Woesearchaeota archaeon]|nr:hypothetical protein [Nanoarchaeota archaeon]MCB9370491.1 hypothetical protein [Candidatus Woesearchaeota archaeon]USN43569.1 MAG: hypothetical protein H6500_04200 [Candidatus Woesearchaeota archaeon]
MAVKKNSFFSHFTLFWKASFFEKGLVFSRRTVEYLLSLYILLIAITFIISRVTQEFDASLAFFIILLAFPVLLLFTYSFFSLFIYALSNSKKKFWEGFVVYLLIALPFMLVFNILELLTFFSSGFFEAFLSFLSGISSLFLLISLVVHLSRFFGCRKAVLLASLLLLFMFVSVVSGILLLSSLLTNLS